MEVRELGVSLGGRQVLKDVALRAPPGTLAWIGGPSGSGKSTLLRALARLVPWSTGEIVLDATGNDGPPPPPHVWRRRVTLLPQPIAPLAPTVGADLRAPFALRVRSDRKAPDDATLTAELQALGLEALRLDRPTGQLSQGQLARVALLRTLLAGPEVVLLDEPTANLDSESARQVAERVREFVAAGGAALVAAHSEPWPGVDRRYRIEGGLLREVAP